jgi:hypothetical protein
MRNLLNYFLELLQINQEIEMEVIIILINK